MRFLATIASAVVFVFAFSGCGLDGEGLKWGEPVAGDNVPTYPGDGGTTPGDGGGGSPGGGGGGIPGGGGGGVTDRRFSGTWIATFGDDLPLGTGRRQYALRLALAQNNSTISGNGSMLRFYNQGATAFDAEPFTVQVAGTANGDDATLVLTAGSRFANNPIIWVRLAGTRMVALYAQRDTNLVLERSAHFVFHKVGATQIDTTWAAAFSDEYGAGGGFVDRDRTGVMTLTENEGVLGGLGTYVEQRPGDVPQIFDFDVVDGARDGTEISFRLGNFVPENGEVVWFGYHSGSIIVAAYGQFNASDQLARFGHATWYQATDVVPADFNRTWVTAFSDTQGAGNFVSDYLMFMTGLSISGNTLTGTVRVLDQSDPSPELVNYTIQNGVVVGNELTMDMVRSGSRFSWNLRLANPVLVGSYQQFGGSDQFVSGGVAEWRFGPTTGFAGTYAASFFDSSTTSGLENRASQLALISLGTVAGDGTFSGAGSVRLASEQSRRQFGILGTVNTNNRIELIWAGADLFGNTSWNLRKAGSFLYGTYTNFASNNQSVEFQGSATFVRVSS